VSFYLYGLLVATKNSNSLHFDLYLTQSCTFLNTVKPRLVCSYNISLHIKEVMLNMSNIVFFVLFTCLYCLFCLSLCLHACFHYLFVFLICLSKSYIKTNQPVFPKSLQWMIWVINKKDSRTKLVLKSFKS